MLGKHESRRSFVSNLLRPAEQAQSQPLPASESEVAFRAAFVFSASAEKNTPRLEIPENAEERKEQFWQAARVVPNIQQLARLALNYRHPDFPHLRLILTAMYEYRDKWWKSLGLTEVEKWNCVNDSQLQEKLKQIEVASLLEVALEAQYNLVKIRAKEYVGDDGMMELASELEAAGWYIFTTKIGPLSAQKVSEVILTEWLGNGILEAKHSIEEYLASKGVPEEFGLLEKVAKVIKKEHHCIRKLRQIETGQFVDHEELLTILDYFGDRYTFINRYEDRVTAKELARAIRQAWKNINFAEVRPHSLDAYLEKHGVTRISEIFPVVLKFFENHPALMDLRKIPDAKTLGESLKLLNRIGTNFRELVGNQMMSGYTMARAIEDMFCEVLDGELELSREGSGAFDRMLESRGITKQYGIRRKIFFLFYGELQPLFDKAKEAESKSHSE